MISSRINIKYNEPIHLSSQESLDCNYYNQGCDGGYGYLVSKYYTENELVTEECYPY
jgi:cathepsin C